MASKSGKTKWTPAQIKEHVKRIQAISEKHRQDFKGEHFAAITPDEIEKKFRRVNSPMFASQGWNNTTPGGTVNLSVTIYNPDPVPALGFVAHLWIGSGNIDPVVGTFLLNVDTRFPRLTLPPSFPSLPVAPGAATTLHFALKVPASAEKTNYLGNLCLMYVRAFDAGTFLDRSGFMFAVS